MKSCFRLLDIYQILRDNYHQCNQSIHLISFVHKELLVIRRVSVKLKY